MADTKISGLPASTTPLAGTEVLPIVQSGTTKQVSVANLTAGRDVSANSFSSAAGAVATPSITTAGDTNTGFWFPAADTIAASTAGTERMRIDSAGRVGIGATPIASTKLTVGGTYAGGTSTVGINVRGTIDPTVSTSAHVQVRSAPDISAGTLPSLSAFIADQATYTGSVTTQFGFNAAAALIGATNNYGFYSNIASGTGRWNFYAAGTAENFMAGSLGIGSAANASALLDVQSTTKGVRMPNMTTVQKNAIASPAAGLMVFDTTLAKLCVYSGAAWQTVTSV